MLAAPSADGHELAPFLISDPNGFNPNLKKRRLPHIEKSKPLSRAAARLQVDCCCRSLPAILLSATYVDAEPGHAQVALNAGQLTERAGRRLPRSSWRLAAGSPPTDR